MKQIDYFVGICIQKEYVSQDEAEWLRYALEKRIVTVIGFAPLLILGFKIANPATVIGFFVAFCSLRTRTNGFHAKSVSRCLLYSIVGEVFFLEALPMVWNNIIAFVALTVSGALIWFFAPYNHPNMDLSSEEVNACAKSAKWRLSMLLFVMSILCVKRQNRLALGILLGIVMAASTLAMAYCLQKAMPEEGK